MRWSSPGGHSSGPKKSSGLTGYANSRRREPIPDGGGCWPGTRSPTRDRRPHLGPHRRTHQAAAARRHRRTSAPHTRSRAWSGRRSGAGHEPPMASRTDRLDLGRPFAALGAALRTGRCGHSRRSAVDAAHGAPAPPHRPRTAVLPRRRPQIAGDRGHNAASPGTSTHVNPGIHDRSGACPCLRRRARPSRRSDRRAVQRLRAGPMAVESPEIPAMPPEHVAELEALDPWWRPPWTVLWQRSYYEARDHARAQGGLRPEHGFPTTSFGLGEWLYNQCTGYDDLHPAQQRLLADIGLTPRAPGRPGPPQAHGHPLPARPRLRPRLR